MLKITKEHSVYAMDKENTPAARANSGDVVIFETNDCFNGSVNSEDDVISEIDFSKVNPATGPLYIEGAEPGDTLKVSIRRIDVAHQGAVVTMPGLGSLIDRIEAEEIAICEVNEDHFVYKGQEFPIRKMIGVIGIAPAGEGIATGSPDAHGGNMDTVEIGENTIVYLPVNVDGALLAIGDLHASMGDGEIMGSGLELAGEVEVQVEVLKENKFPTPFVETEDKYITIASAKTMEEAAKMAINNMVDLMISTGSFDLNQAGMLLSLVGDLKVSQIVNPNKTMRMELNKNYIDI